MDENSKTRRTVLKTVGVGAIASTVPTTTTAKPGRGRSPPSGNPEQFLDGKAVFITDRGPAKNAAFRARELRENSRAIGARTSSSIHSADVAVLPARNRFDNATIISALNNETTVTFAGPKASTVLPSVLELSPGKANESVSSSNFTDLNYNIGLSSVNLPSDICVANPISETGNINMSYYDTGGNTNKLVLQKIGKTIGLDQAQKRVYR